MNSKHYYAVQFDKKLQLGSQENKQKFEQIALFTAPFIEMIEGKGILIIRVNKKKYLVQAQEVKKTNEQK